MAYEDDPYRDEDGEPLMDYDDIPSDRDPSPSPQPRNNELLDDDVEDWDTTRERSQTPVYDADKVGKPKKRLIKKSTTGKESVAPELIDDEDFGFGAEDAEMERRKRKKGKEGGGGGGGGSGKKEKKFKGEKKYMSSSSSGKGSGSRKGMMDSGRLSAKDREVDEMWTHVGANDEVVITFF